MIFPVSIGIKNYSNLVQAQKIQNTNLVSLPRVNSDSVSFSGNSETKSSLFETVIKKSIGVLENIKSRIPQNVIAISGPSGVGKDTMIDAIKKLDPSIESVLSYYTRQPRPGEIHGVTCYFIPQKQFDEMSSRSEFLQQLSLNGKSYGGTIAEVDMKSKGHDTFYNLSSETAHVIRERYGKKAVLIFINEPSREETRRRLIKRGTETAETIEKRMAYGVQQMEHMGEFDKVIVNDNLDVAVKEAYEYIKSRRSTLVKTINSTISFLAKRIK